MFGGCGKWRRQDQNGKLKLIAQNSMPYINASQCAKLQNISAAGKPLFGIELRNMGSLSKLQKQAGTESARRERMNTSLISRRHFGAGRWLEKTRIIGAADSALSICACVVPANISSGKLRQRNEPTIAAKNVGSKMEPHAHVVGRKSSCTAITCSLLQNFQNQDLTQKTVLSFVQNATPSGITEKSGELLGSPYGIISSQASHVTSRPGAKKVQRLGGEDNNNPPTSARRESDDIVWTAWQHAEVGHKQSDDNIIGNVRHIPDRDTVFVDVRSGKSNSNEA